MLGNTGLALFGSALLSGLCNMRFSDNNTLKSIRQALEVRLPPGWRVEVLHFSGKVYASLRFTSSEGRSCDVTTVIKGRIDPRTANRVGTNSSVLVVAPYLSNSVREVLEQRGASYADQTGNIRVILKEPGLFILTSGATVNPWPDKRQLTLRGVKAGRVVRALVRSLPPLGVRELAQLADTDPGYVSRLLSMLDSEALVDRTSRGRVERVAWRKLLKRWAEDAPLSSRSTATTWLAPRGLKSVFERLKDIEAPYLITGSAVATKVAPIAPTRLLSMYVEDPTEVANALDLRIADAGVNVILLEPEDEAIYEQANVSEDLRQAALPLVVADLLTGPGRSPVEGDATLDWMTANEEAWRG